ERELDGERGARGAAELEERVHVDAVDVLQHLERVAVGDAVVEDRDHAGVVELARDPRLVEEHAPERRVDRVTLQEPLDGDAALEAVGAGRDRLEDLRHAALADAPGDPVAAHLHAGWLHAGIVPLYDGAWPAPSPPRPRSSPPAARRS